MHKYHSAIEMLILRLFNCALSTAEFIQLWINWEEGHLWWVCKDLEESVTYLKVLFTYSPRETEEDHENPQTR
jgi:hypothetical protein